jgi:hypothetical protein
MARVRVSTTVDEELRKDPPDHRIAR